MIAKGSSLPWCLSCGRSGYAQSHRLRPVAFCFTGAQAHASSWHVSPGVALGDRSVISPLASAWEQLLASETQLHSITTY